MEHRNDDRHDESSLFGTPRNLNRRKVYRVSGSHSNRSPAEAFEVIGVVPNTRTSVFDDGQRPLFYRSVGQAPATTATVIIRTSLEPASLLPSMQRVVRSLDSALPIITATTITRHIADSLGMERAAAASLGGLGALGLGLAGLGMHAVVAFAVSRRTREIGIRMALGARRTQVIWTVSRNTATLLGVGVVTGLGLVVEYSGVGLNGVQPVSRRGCRLSVPTADLPTFVLVTVLMAAVGLAAAFFPARRAVRVDPLVALRHL